MSGRQRPVIAVIGASAPDADAWTAAQRLGEALAAAGADVVCGGLGGVMEAVCQGARGGGARTIGILPGTDRTAANAHVDVAVPTGLGEARNALVVRAGDAVVAVAGGWGTLSEIALARRMGRPVIGLATWRAIDPDGVEADLPRATDPADAARRALDAARRAPETAHDPGPPAR